MQNLMNDLMKLFQKDDRIFADGKLLKNKLTELALKLDQPLIELLLSDKKAKEHFFVQKIIKKDKILIFDKDKFISFVNNKEFLPDSFTSFKNKIGLMTNGDYLKEKGDVVLTWAYKDCVLEGGQDKEDQKRDEIFYNEILSPDEIDRLFEPKVLTNFKKYDSKGQHAIPVFNGDDNLIIKGNNLLALHCLKQNFRGQIKLIYIDPPYNTGNDEFKYNDSFNHSTWLTFMKNRLVIAEELLKDDGAIFIQINDIEQAHLKILCDEIFGREHFHTAICIQMSHLSGVKMAHKEVKLPKIKEWILFYTKNEKIKLNPQYIPATWEDALERYSSFILKSGFSDEQCDKWKIIPLNQAMKEAGVNVKDSKAVLNFKLSNAHLIFRTARNRGADYSKLPKNKFSKIDNPDGSYYFVYKGEDVSFSAEKVMVINGKKTPVVTVGDIWTDIGINNLSNEGGVDLRFGKKPEKLISRLIELCTKKGDLILDFFAGSGTSGAVAHKSERKYILIEQLDEHVKKMLKRLKHVIAGEDSGISKEFNWNGGGSFVYAELKEWNEQYMANIKDANTTLKLLNIYEKMRKEAFFRYDIDLSKFEEQEFKKLPLKEQKQVLCECLDKNHLYVNLSEINDTTYKVSADDKKLNKEFHKTVI